MSKQLFKSLLKYEFYTEVSSVLSDGLFPAELKPLYNTLVYAHNKYCTDITTSELLDLHKSLHPTLTSSNIHVLTELLESINAEEEYNPDIAYDVLTECKKRNKCRELIYALLDIEQGKSDDWGVVKSMLEESEDDSDTESEAVTLEDFLDVIEGDEGITGHMWKFNLESLQEATNGLPEVSFGVVGARPEVGKTAFYISLICNEGGFLDQGANVHVWRNEEHYSMVARRAVSSYLGIPFEEAHNHKQEYVDKINQSTGKLSILKDSVTESATVDDLERYLARNTECDILIIDQIDNLTLDSQTSVTSDTETLTILYSRIRQLSTRYKCAIIALTQAGATAEGKLYFGYSDLYGSKTGKAAAADYVFCIGASRPPDGQQDRGYRMLNFAKNKLKGPHPPVSFMLSHDVSRISM